MIDLTLRMDYADVFDFDKFHEAFRQMLASAKGDECINLLEYIESNPQFWCTLDFECSSTLAMVLATEVNEYYHLCPDFNDLIHLPKAEKKKTPQRNIVPSIRTLIKEFLEGKSTPQPLSKIVEYVNHHRKEHTNRNSVRTNMGLDKDVFAQFQNSFWGLRSMPYGDEFIPVEASQRGKRYKFEEDGTSMVIEHEFSYNSVKTNLLIPEFELRYSTKREHKPTEFFTNALSNSSRLDLGLGYFSSACFNVLACGFAHFIKNDGVMRMYINPHVTEEDYKLLKAEGAEGFENYLVGSYDKLFKIFSKRDELFFRCLAFLIAKKRIEVKMVVLNEGGIAHEKFGIFTDSEANEVAFNGSMNLTAAGLTRNIESIDCTCSWRTDDAKNRIACYHDDFNSIWNKENPDVMVFPADEFCKRVLQSYPTEEIDDLIILENEVLQEIKEEQRQNPIAEVPHFPSKFRGGAFSYQMEAYDKWVSRGKKGVFAMATGTGKTITSLNCALEEYYKDDFYRLLILVPSLALVEQWEDEARNFNYKNIICVSSDNSRWKKNVVALANKLSHGRNVNFVIISTYQSFVMDDFQVLLKDLSNGTILIADEAHNIGSEGVRSAFRKLSIERRIALSATPKRIYDEEGTREIETFFNDTHPYTYSFSMRRAIVEERLMSYYYFPYLAKLEEDEMIEYAKITRQLVQMYNETKEGFADPERARRLLLLRKNILHKAHNKMIVFQQIIQEIGQDKLKYCFVYSAAGKRSRSDEQDDEALDEYILQEMQRILKQTFPDTTCNSYTGVDSKQLRKQKLEAFASGQLDVLFAKNCLDEGVDVPRAEYGIFTSSTGNPRQFIQRRGRLLRKHEDKRFAWIYDIIVVPDFTSPFYERRFWTMEKHLVENEMRRVANFGSLASNYYTGALETLNEVISFYDIDLNGMVLNEEE